MSQNTRTHTHTHTQYTYTYIHVKFTNTQYNPMNHQTLIIIAGGRESILAVSKKIYYAMSKDICNNSIDNIWQISEVSLPREMSRCKCIITHESTMNPKFIILGGQDRFLEYDLRDIIGDNTFKHFMLDFLTVML